MSADQAEGIRFANAELRRNLRATRRAQRQLLRKAARMGSGMAASREWLLSDIDRLGRSAQEIERYLGITKEVAR